MASCYGSSYWYATAFKRSTNDAELRPLLDEAIRLHRRYCEVATPAEIEKQGPCMLDNWTAARRSLGR